MLTKSLSVWRSELSLVPSGIVRRTQQFSTSDTTIFPFLLLVQEFDFGMV